MVISLAGLAANVAPNVRNSSRQQGTDPEPETNPKPNTKMKKYTVSIEVNYTGRVNLAVLGGPLTPDMASMLEAMGYPERQSPAGSSLRWGTYEELALKANIDAGPGGITAAVRREAAALESALNSLPDQSAAEEARFAPDPVPAIARGYLSHD